MGNGNVGDGNVWNGYVWNGYVWNGVGDGIVMCGMWGMCGMVMCGMGGGIVTCGMCGMCGMGGQYTYQLLLSARALLKMLKLSPSCTEDRGKVEVSVNWSSGTTT